MCAQSYLGVPHFHFAIKVNYRTGEGTCSTFIFLDNVLRAVLALFMEDEALPLPSLEEVLICNSSTTAEEVRARISHSSTHNLMGIIYSVHMNMHSLVDSIHL